MVTNWGPWLFVVNFGDYTISYVGNITSSNQFTLFFFWDEVILSCMGVIICQYKDPVINQPGFHGSCHWWVLFPQLETLRRSLQLMHSAAFPILLPSGCSPCCQTGGFVFMYIYIYIYEHIVDRYTCTSPQN